MPLFHVQDSDRPMFVIARDYQDALNVWVTQVGVENDLTKSEVTLPRGISYVCSDDELIICPPG